MFLKLRFLSVLIFLVSASLFGQGTPAPADYEPEDVPGRAVARISLINGDVSVRRGDSGEYVAAALNAPLMVQDCVATGPSSRAEIQLDHANMVRLGQNTEVRFTEVEANRYQMQIAHGTVTYRVLRESSAQVELSTPQLSVRPIPRSSTRVAVLDDGQTQITVRSGEVEIYTPRGVEQVRAGQTMLARGTASDPEFQMVAASGFDDWDRWNDERDRRLETAESYRYVSRDIYGAEDLEGHGQWVQDPAYGYVWSPRVEAGWAPYRAGRWVWEDFYGWTWVSSEPWGWAPYHYGNWYYGRVGWCWYPGPIYSHHFWRPALVAFFGFGHGFGASFGFGNVGWVPLAPFERFRPWYGRGYNGGRGGGFNNINIVNNTNITNIYRNARYANGITAVNAQDFSRGRFNNTLRVGPGDIRQAGLVRGQLPLTPTSGAMRFSDRQTQVFARGNDSRQFFTRGSAGQLNRGAGDWRQPGQSVVTNPGARGNSGWQRFGAPARSLDPAPQVRTITPQQQNQAPRDNSNWSRFGAPNRSMDSYRNNPVPQYQSRPDMNGGYNRYAAPNVDRSQRFGGDASQSRAPRTYAPYYGGRSESLQISPPIVRERAMPNYSRPNSNYGGGNYGGGGSRHDSAPSPRSAPSYSAPSYRGGGGGGGSNNAPRSGGGGGGGGRDSGSRGGHGR